MAFLRIAALALIAIAFATGAPAQAPAPMLDPAVLKDLVAANRILVAQGVIDVRGHISVRDPADPNRFWISRAIAPGAVVAGDMQVFDLEGKQLGGAAGEAYSERLIHARVYKARPDVKSVVHAHTRSIVTMSASGLPLKPVNSGAAFAGAVVPMIEGSAIHDIPGGDRLTGVLKNGGAAIMQGHGVVVVGPSIQSAVGRSVGLDANTQMLISILQMHGKPVYIIPAADAAAQPGNYGREWDWWKRQAGVE